MKNNTAAKPKLLISLNDIASSGWTRKGFHGLVHPFFSIALGCPLTLDLYGAQVTKMFFVCRNNYMEWYWNDEDLTRMRTTFFDKLQKKKISLPALKRSWQCELRVFDTIAHEIDVAPLSKMSNREILDLYKKFHDQYIEEYRYFMAVGDAISMHADRYIEPEFRKRLGSSYEQLFPQLVRTKHVSFIDQELIDRNKLVRYYIKHKTVSSRALENHAQQYFFIQNNYARGVRLTAEDFLKLIKKDARHYTPVRKKAVPKTPAITLTSYQKLLLKVIDEFFEIQDTRKKYVLKAVYYQLYFLRELSKRWKIDFTTLSYTTFFELEAINKGTFDLSLLEDRKKGCCVMYVGARSHVYTGHTVDDVVRVLQSRQSQKEFVQGMVASRGVVSGRVKVILKIHDLVNIRKNDILVTSMTRPEMVPAMKLASAIVTDEGGITSHAAIVSRELGIPCIIGTKIATQTFKDGDRILVDAEKGIIKKLS